MPASRRLNKLPQKAQTIRAFCGFTFVPFVYRLNRSPAGHQVNNQNDHCHHEQQMDKVAADM
jgi:hypothetical protein